MFFATFLNVIFIPVLYVVVQTMRRAGPARAGGEEDDLLPGGAQ